MFVTRVTTALGFALLAWPLAAQDVPRVIDRAFGVTVVNDEGIADGKHTTRVPLLPGRSCYTWHIRLQGGPSKVKISELLQLPAPAEIWGTGNSELSDDGSAARTTRVLEPEEGWIAAQWCVTEGDPTGPHAITVTSGDWLDETFRFEVVER